MSVEIRRARRGEAAGLRELAHRSKAHWGYDAEFLEAVRPLMQLTDDDIERDDVFVLEEDGRALGWYRLSYPMPAGAELEDLWLAPEAIGSGRGRTAWEHAVRTARARGARTLEWDADPNAEAFYRAMGGRRVGESPSSVIPGRSLPRMRFELAGDEGGGAVS